MDQWLNYHHLLYFWTVAKDGSVARASERLHLTQPTVSEQVHQLEKKLGVKLFRKKGRQLELTEEGQRVFRYADEIFAIGRELLADLKQTSSPTANTFTVGVVDSLSKFLVINLILPALQSKNQYRLVCYEGKHDQLLDDLVVHKLDLILSDQPVNLNLTVKAYSHLLGETTVSVMGTRDLAKQFHGPVESSLKSAPVILPTLNTTLRRSLDQWFDKHGISPNVAAELEDSALVKVLGQTGRGLFFVPTAIEKRVSQLYDVVTVGRIESITERFYALNVERRIKHPAVMEIAKSAKAELFR